MAELKSGSTIGGYTIWHRGNFDPATKLNANANAVSSSKLETPRTITASGDAAWTVTFDGQANVSAVLTLANSGVTAGTYTKVTVNAKGLITSATTLAATDIPNLDTAKITTGTLPIARGGTGLTGATQGGIYYGSSASATAFTAAGTTNQVLKSNGAGAPTWVTLDLSYMPDAAVKKSVRVATTSDLSTGTFSAGVLTGKSTNPVVGCTTSAGSTTITTNTQTLLKVGAVVSVATAQLAAGTAITSINSSTSFTVSNRATINTTAITSNGTTATSTFATQSYAPYAVGSTITITGAVPATYNGNFIVTACTTTSVSWSSTETVTATTQGAITFTIATGTLINTTWYQTIAALSIDGITVALNDRVLVKDQSANLQNGIYYVSTLGTTAVPWVLTRVSDADTSTKIAGSNVNVDSGTSNGGLRFDTDFKTTDTINATSIIWNRVVDTGLASTIVGSTPGTAAVGTSINYARADHVHPVQTTITGNAATATKLATARTISTTGDATWSVSFDGSANVSGTLTLASSGATAGTYKAVTVDTKGRVTAGVALVTGLVTSTSTTGTSNVVTTNTNTYLNVVETVGTTPSSAGTSTQISGAGTVTVTSDAAGKLTITGDQNITGNAGTATKLATARTINGVSFDGSGNITIGEPTFANPLATYASGDANALNTGGFNVRYLNSSAANKPTGTDHAVMTLNYSAIWSGQQAFDWRTGDVFTRTQNNGTWLSWATQVDSRNYATTIPTFSVNSAGLVPARVGSTTTKFLREDGTWVVPTDTTYEEMTEANAIAGTETTARLITAAVLKSAIQTHAPTPTNISGNAGTATKLATARTINGVAFDGTANITVADSTKAPLASPALTGTPTAPTATDGTNTTQLATTAFVQNTVGGYLNKTGLTGGTVTLTDVEVSNAVLSFSGTLTSNLIIVVPVTNRRLWSAINATTGNFTLTVKTASGTGVTVAQGKRNLIYTDGTNVQDGFNDFENIALTGAPTTPTAAVATNSTQVASTAFVQAVNNADTGSSSTALTLKTARTFTYTGDVTGSVSFNGGANVSAAMTLANSGVTAGTYKSVTVDAKGRVTAGTDVVTSLVTSTSATGTTNAATTNTDTFLNIVEKVGTANASPGTSTQVTGAGTVTVSSDTAGKLTITGAQSITGNAATATKLATIRTINGVNFDGTANITVADSTKAPLASPTLTGTPTAPTATDGTNTTQIATTAFVQNTVGGYLSKTGLTGGTITLTDAEVSNAVLYFAGALTSNLIVVVPVTNRRLWAAINGTTGAFTLTVKTSAGTGVTVAQGKRNLIYTDGTNVQDAFNDFDSIALTGIPTSTTAASTTNTTQVATTAFVQAVNASDTGSAATAVALKTARTINGVSFNGTANITVADATKLPLSGGTLTGTFAATAIGITNTVQTNGVGLSLYGGANAGMPSYGLAFSGTATFGTHGSVVGDWATYFTMSGATNRGWIFKSGNAAGGNIASISAAGAFQCNGAIVAGGDITAFSDARLKTEIEKIANAVDKIKQLNGYTYTRIDSGKRQTGLIAQELEKVLPEAVVQGADYKSVAYGNIVGLLVEAIKELENRIAVLECK